MVDAASAWKLGSLAFKLLARASRVRDHEPLATFLAVTERLQEKIERDSDQWLRSEFGSELAEQADALAAIAALDDILSRSLPDGLSVAQANLSPDRIADLVVAKAGQADASFHEPTFGERLLHCLVQRAYEEAKRDHHFAAVIDTPVSGLTLLAVEREREPLDWNLGNALLRLGERERETARQAAEEKQRAETARQAAEAARRAAGEQQRAEAAKLRSREPSVGPLGLRTLRSVGDTDKEPRRDQATKTGKYFIIAGVLVALISGILLYFGILTFLSTTTPGSAIETLLQTPATPPPPTEAATAPSQTEAAMAPPPTEAATAPSQTEEATAPPPTEAATAPPQTEAATAPPQTEAATAAPQTEAATAPPQTEAATAPSQAEAATAPSQAEAAMAPPRTAPTTLRRTAPTALRRTAPTALRRTPPSRADQLNREEILRIDHPAYRGATRYDSGVHHLMPTTP